MAKVRGKKGTGRAAHKRKNKKTGCGRFVPLEDPEEVLKYKKRKKAKMCNSVRELFNERTS